MEYKASVNKLTQPLVQQLIDKPKITRWRGNTGKRQHPHRCRYQRHRWSGSRTHYCRNLFRRHGNSLHQPQPLHHQLAVIRQRPHRQPVLGCLGSQYAGWSLSHEKYYALGSGPARAMATKVKNGEVEPVEELYKELDYRDTADSAVLVIENDKLPPLEIIEKVATACKVSPDKLTIIVTPTSSLAGGVQVVARVLEVAMHKAHALHFPLENIIDGSGSAPICPPHPNFVKAMGRTNDAILFAGQVHLFVKGSDEAAEELAKNLPSSTSKDYGKPFAEIFKQYEYDFFKIDAMLFSPASVIVTAVDSGKSFRAGNWITNC